MIYKGYKIVASIPSNDFFEVGDDGEIGQRVTDVLSVSVNGFDEPWYAVIDKDGWVEQSFESLEEAKEGVDWAIKEGILDEVPA